MGELNRKLPIEVPAPTQRRRRKPEGKLKVQVFMDASERVKPRARLASKVQDATAWKAAESNVHHGKHLQPRCRRERMGMRAGEGPIKNGLWEQKIDMRRMLPHISWSVKSNELIRYARIQCVASVRGTIFLHVRGEQAIADVILKVACFEIARIIER